MKLSEFAGYGDKMAQLMRSVQAGRIVHALLFVGPHGSGKRTMARLFAQALVCRGEGARPCGVCPACKRFEAGSHPDVHVIRPGMKDDAPEKDIWQDRPKGQGKAEKAAKKGIGVDEVRALIDAMSLTPYEGGRHIAVIEQADRMSPAAQNALLKTLESPPGDAMFFLITDAPGAILTTIVSRCQTVRFSDLSVEDCAAALVARGIAPDRARLLAGLAQGSVGRALEIDGDADWFELRDRVIASLEALKRPADVASAASGLIEEKGREGEMLDIMELWARDAMAVQSGATPYQADQRSRLERFPFSGQALLKGVLLARMQLASNVSWTGALEYLYFHLTDTEKSGRTALSWQR